MRSSLLGFSAIVIVACGASERTVEVRPLVDANWLVENLDAVTVLDIRRDRSSGAAGDNYWGGHIPGAVHSDYARASWQARRGGVPGMLPAVETLENLIGGLGISNDVHVVIAAAGTSSVEMASATRVYWIFKVLGHEAVSILDGGYSAWRMAGLPIERDVNRPQRVDYTADYRADLVANRDDVLEAMEAGTPLIDTRSARFYNGEAKAGVAARHGTIQGARNVPHESLTREGGGLLVDEQTAATLWSQAGLPAEGEQIAFCNLGYLASLGWYIAYEILGNKEARLYDGSLADWSADESLPMENTAIIRNE